MSHKYTYNLLSNGKLYSSTFTGQSILAGELLLQYSISDFDFLKQSDKSFENSVGSNKLSLLPLAVRYISPENDFYVIERPPFQVDVDFSSQKSYDYRKSPKYLHNTKVWIPWTVCTISLGSRQTSFASNYTFSIYFNDKPLTSFEDSMVACFLPNSSNGNICMGADSGPASQLIRDNAPIVDIYNHLFNSYFAGWNCDIHNVLPYPEYFNAKNIIKRIIDSKKGPKSFDSISGGRSVSKTYNQMLFVLSQLSLEEMLDYIAYCKEKIAQSFSQRHTKTLQNIIDSFVKRNTMFDYSSYHRNPDYLTNNLISQFNEDAVNHATVRVYISNASKEDYNLFNTNPYLIAKIYKDYQDKLLEGYFSTCSTISLFVTKEELMPYVSISEEDNSDVVSS